MGTLIIPFIGELTGLVRMLKSLRNYFPLELYIFLKRFRTSASVRMPPSIWRKMDLQYCSGLYI